MKTRDMRRAALVGVMTPMLLLAACAETPMGPTVQVMPAPGKPLDVFAADQAGCRQFAQQSVAGQAQNANTRAVGAAALTTVVGAGLGAAIGGGRGAAIGAGAGALGGTGIGAATSSNAQLSIQDQYNNAYAQCMFTRGNMVPGMGPVMMQGTPAPNLALTRPVQIELIRLGYMGPPADGTLGPQTSTAISRFQGMAGMPVDGMPSAALLATLQATR
jgi:hypothetical protein